MGSLTIYWRSPDRTGMANPPAESIAAVDPAAVETLRPLDLQFTNGEHANLSLWILPITWNQIMNNNNSTRNIQMSSGGIPYLKENRETVAGQGWATRMSLRANVGRALEFTDTNSLDNMEETASPSRILSSTCKKRLSKMSIEKGKKKCAT